MEDTRFDPDVEVAFVILSKAAAGEAQDICDWLADTFPDGDAMWHTPVPYDPRTCKSCGNRDANNYPQYGESLLCSNCVDRIEAKQAALIEALELVDRWLERALTLQEIRATTNAAVTLIASRYSDSDAISA